MSHRGLNLLALIGSGEASDTLRNGNSIATQPRLPLFSKGNLIWALHAILKTGARVTVARHGDGYLLMLKLQVMWSQRNTIINLSETYYHHRKNTDMEINGKDDVHTGKNNNNIFLTHTVTQT